MAICLKGEICVHIMPETGESDALEEIELAPDGRRL